MARVGVVRVYTCTKGRRSKSNGSLEAEFREISKLSFFEPKLSFLMENHQECFPGFFRIRPIYDF